MAQEALSKTDQEQMAEAPSVPEIVSVESLAKFSTEKKAALDILKDRSANETHSIEENLTRAAQELGGTSEEVAPITAQIDELETKKESVIEDAHTQISEDIEEFPPPLPEDELPPPYEDDELPPPLPGEKPSNKLTERAVVNPNELSAHEISKEKFANERSQLAAEIREGRNSIREMRSNTEALRAKLDSISELQEDIQPRLTTLLEQRAALSSTLAGRVFDFLHLQSATDKALEQQVTELQAQESATREEWNNTSKELQEGMYALIDGDVTIDSLKAKLVGHYKGALDSEMKKVEQTAMRNNAFFVHVFSDSEGINGNNSMIASKDLADSLDVVTSIEPSISASAVEWGTDQETNTKVSGLWGGGAVGVILGGGDIQEGHKDDASTRTAGLKQRVSGRKTGHTTEEIDSVVSSSRKESLLQDAGRGNYNEFVINNPKVAGFFVTPRVEYTDAGEMRLKYEHGLTTEKENCARAIRGMQNRIKIAEERGIPFYIRDRSNNFCPCRGVTDEGVLLLDPAITPEDIAKGKAGLLPEERKKTGDNLLERNVFRDRAKAEAKGIVDSL